MKNVIVAMLIVILLAIPVLAICIPFADAAVSNSNEMFVTVEQGWNYQVVYCRTNRVMYAVSRGYANSGTFTLLVNPDNSPMLYELEYCED